MFYVQFDEAPKWSFPINDSLSDESIEEALLKVEAVLGPLTRDPSPDFPNFSLLEYRRRAMLRSDGAPDVVEILVGRG